MPPYELDEILSVLPHRAPFLFVDRVVLLEPGRQIVAERTLRADEAYFAGHFPGRAIMPGVLVAEALAQTSGLLVGLSEKLTAGVAPVQPKAMFLATTQLKFTRPAVPGDTLILKARGDMLHTLENQLKQQGLTLDKLGITPQDYREKNREEAVRRIKGFLLFDSIALQNHLEVTEEEMQARMADLAQRYKQPVEAIYRYYQEHNMLRPLFNQILEEKTLDFLLSQADITEVKPGEAEKSDKKDKKKK